MTTPTTNYGWPVPVDGASETTWGDENNDCWNEADADLYAVATTVPLTAKDATFTFGLANLGNTSRKTDATATGWTIAPQSSVTWPVGSVLPFRLSNAAGAVTLSPGVGVTLNWAGSSSTGARTLSAGAMGTIYREASDVWVVAGTGIS